MIVCMTMNFRCYAGELNKSAENVVYTIVEDGRINFAFPSTIIINSYMLQNDYRTLRYHIEEVASNQRNKSSKENELLDPIEAKPNFNSYIVPLNPNDYKACLLNLIPGDEESKKIFIEWYKSGQLYNKLSNDTVKV